jgi:hypothetical protein
MAIVIPNKDDAFYPLQSRVYSTHFQVLNNVAAGTFVGKSFDSGPSATPAGGMDVTVHMYGYISILNVLKFVSFTTIVTLTSDSSYDQWCLVAVDDSYLPVVLGGTANPLPEMPSIARVECCLFSVYVPAGTTTITSDMILEFYAPVNNDLTPLMREFTDTSTAASYGGVGAASQSFRNNIGLQRQSAGGFFLYGGGVGHQPVDAVVHVTTSTVYVMMGDTTFYSWNNADYTALATPPAGATQLAIDYLADGGDGYVYALVDGGVDLWRYRIGTDSWTQMSSHPGATMQGATLGACNNYLVVAGCGTVQTDSKKLRFYNVGGDSWYTDTFEFSTTYTGLTLSKDMIATGVSIFGAYDVVTGTEVALTGSYTPGSNFNEQAGASAYTGFPTAFGRWVGGSDVNNIVWNGLILVNDD